MGWFKKDPYKQVGLVFSDLHAPYNHQDACKFLFAVADAYSIGIRPLDFIVSCGDNIDCHKASRHMRDPDLPNFKAELLAAREELRPLYQRFPKVKCCNANHGARIESRALEAGLSREVLKSHRSILSAPTGWRWADEWVIHTPAGPALFCHGRTRQIQGLSKQLGVSTYQGHYHTLFNINARTGASGVLYDVFVGCLIDNDALAMKYNKTHKEKPVLGCCVILDGCPKLIPMQLTGRGRWDGKV